MFRIFKYFQIFSTKIACRYIVIIVSGCFPERNFSSDFSGQSFNGFCKVLIIHNILESRIISVLGHPNILVWTILWRISPQKVAIIERLSTRFLNMNWNRMISFCSGEYNSCFRKIKLPAFTTMSLLLLFH